MNATWIVSANASRARFFSQGNATEPLEEIDGMINDGARLRGIDIESDEVAPRAAAKSMHGSGSPAPNKTYQPAQTPEMHQAELFARDIADYLLKAYQAGRFQKLSLVVSPQFLGVLRKLLDPQLGSAVRLEINKDYTQFSPTQLLEQIRGHGANG
ncbi:host attachment protein [Herbaspirillum sp. HC18]|nr:host attachment protein [Herbaspirillum sp. HC18]